MEEGFHCLSKALYKEGINNLTRSKRLMRDGFIMRWIHLNKRILIKEYYFYSYYLF